MKNNEFRIIKRDNFDKVKLDWIWLLLVFLFSLNLYNNAFYILIVTLLVGAGITYYKGSRFKVTVEFILLILFSFSYFLILHINSILGFFEMALYLFCPIGCFFIGYFIVQSKKKLIVNTIFAIAVGNFLYGTLNMFNYFNAYGFTSTERNVPDIWTGIYMAATLQGAHFTLLTSLLFFGIAITKNNNMAKVIILLAGIIFSIFSSLILGNRTLIITTIAIFLVNTLLYFVLTKNNIKQLIRMYMYIGFFILIMTLIYNMNLFGVKDFIFSSQFANRIEETSINEDPRLAVYGNALNQMFDYPFGGYQMDLGLEYAHNLWIDVLYASGLIPFFFLLLYTIKTLYNLYFILRNQHIELLFKILILSIYLGYLLNFMVEPILEGTPYMFFSFCIINGMISKYKFISKNP
ncbi:hypothetical protein [Peribacillus sp. R9-11]|uniref:hypothetical protein n=1 Tax=Peribacillus sp. R9-11 TaxID=3073271 RepID=UPI00286891D5|nr:hypothetical protein [Peribacillus sp. R9-11]WMX54275.1 hypothetical protein RE409_19665 [Peribacillus sp. R9-11]